MTHLATDTPESKEADLSTDTSAESSQDSTPDISTVSKAIFGKADPSEEDTPERDSHTEAEDSEADDDSTTDDSEAGDTPDTDSSTDDTSEYDLTAEDLGLDDEAANALSEKIAQANKGIRQRFTKLDADYKAKEKALSQREALASEAEQILVKALEENLGIDGKTPEGLDKLISLHPAIKEMAERTAALEQQVMADAIETIRRATYGYLEGIGYTATEIQQLFTKDKGTLAAKYEKLLSSGLTVEEAIRALGITSKRKAIKAPPKSTQNTASGKPDLRRDAKAIFG